MRTVTANTFGYVKETERPSGIEMGMVSVVFLFASGIFDPALVPKFGILRINDLFMITAAGFGVALQFTRLFDSFSKLSSRSLVLVFSVYAFMGLSLLWTHSPSTGIPRFVGFSLTTLWTLYAATRFSIRELLQILLITFLSIAVVSALLAVAVPDLGTMTVAAHKGDWKGVYEQKNTLGRNMSVLVTVALFCLIYSGPRGLGAAAVVIGLVVLYMSGSRTALGIGLLGMASVLFLYFRRRPFLIIGITLSSIAGGLFFALQTIIEGNPILQLQGENLSLFQTQLHFTGRFGLWQFSVESIIKKPWFGYGFDGFWKVKSLGGQTVDLEGWQARDAHNGYIDIVLQTGLVGLAGFFIVYWAFTLKVLHRLRRPRVAYEDLFAGLNLFVFFFANITESYAFKATSIYQMLFTLSLVILCKRRDISPEKERRDGAVLEKLAEIAAIERPTALRSRSPSSPSTETTPTMPASSNRTFLRRRRVE